MTDQGASLARECREDQTPAKATERAGRRCGSGTARDCCSHTKYHLHCVHNGRPTHSAVLMAEKMWETARAEAPGLAARGPTPRRLGLSSRFRDSPRVYASSRRTQEKSFAAHNATVS